MAQAALDPLAGAVHEVAPVVEAGEVVGDHLTADGVVLVRVGERALDVVLERAQDVVVKQSRILPAGGRRQQRHVADVLHLHGDDDLVPHRARELK